MSADDDIERTLCQLPQVHVFKIPARKSAEGHRASDWPKDPSWTGKLRIVAKGRTAAIILFDDKNNVFAICKVTDDTAVERTLDSGRYFVLRITNPQGRHAFIGIAFNERNDAFDFNVALSEFRNELEREDKASKLSETPAQNTADLSLKEGEKIKIKFTPKKKTTDTDGDQPTTVFTSATNKPAVKSGGLLPPPADMKLAPPMNNTNNSNIKSAVSALPPVKSSSSGTSTATTDPFDMNGFGKDDVFGSFSDPFATSSSDPFASTSSSSDPFASSSDPFASFEAPSAAKPVTGSKSTNNSQPNNGGNVNLLDF